MSNVIKSTRALPFDKDQMLYKTQILIESMNELDKLEEEFKQIKSDYTSKIKLLKSNIIDLRKSINDGTEVVKVEITYNEPYVGSKTVRRLDCEQSWIEDMSDEEKKQIEKSMFDKEKTEIEFSADNLNKEDEDEIENEPLIPVDDFDDENKISVDKKEEKYLIGTVIQFNNNGKIIAGKILAIESDDIIDKNFYKIEDIKGNSYYIEDNDIVK